MGIKLDPGCMVGAGVNWGVRLLGKDVSWSRDAGAGLFTLYDTATLQKSCIVFTCNMYSDMSQQDITLCM